jgi:DNA phosphorothioation-associated DGQHR protein 1
VPYHVRGAQRDLVRKKVREIGSYIDTVEAAFPNSIILGANYSEGGELIHDEAVRWKIESSDGHDELVIPSAQQLASVIDGQHRLYAFNLVAPERQRAVELLCAVYLDLPAPYHAYLFATINFNQKKVDRSLAYELFGYDLENEPPAAWSPEKAAVFFCRKLNTESDSPLATHIRVAAANSDFLMGPNGSWYISTAAVVDGILRLFSSAPKADKDTMHRVELSQRSRSVLTDDGTPFRALFLEGNDLAVYTAIKNFFTAASQTVWRDTNERSYIRKTVGIQALFDVMRTIILRNFSADRSISVPYFVGFLAPASRVNFADDFFQASGKGRTRIKNLLEAAGGLNDLATVHADDQAAIRRLLGS